MTRQFEKKLACLRLNVCCDDVTPFKKRTTSSQTMEEDTLVVERCGPVRVVTLNRPRQLNVLTQTIVDRLHSIYSEAEQDASIKCVVLKGSGRAFCAGGDVRAVYDTRPPFGDPRRRTHIEALEFFETEYEMIHLLSTRLSKTTPHVALMDGVVMGGGCGVSINGRFRIATERTVLAMPECAIGLVPDVGGTHFLSKLPGEVGTCMALTGRRVSGADAKALGLATHLVHSAALDGIVESLVDALEIGGESSSSLDAVVDACLRNLEGASASGAGATGAACAELGVEDLATNRALIDRWFAADAVEDIVASLASSSAASTSHDQGRKLASELLSAMRASSPTSMKVTLAAMRSSPSSLAECLRSELCMVAACLARDDFYEGVRARLVDKGKGAPPAWQPGELAGVSAAEVSSDFFAPETGEVEAVVRRFEAAVGLLAESGESQRGVSPRL